MSKRGRIAEDYWLELPVPPSVNKKYISRRFVVSKEWRDYKEYVGKYCIEAGISPISGDVEVRIKWYRERKAGDIDSKIKCLLDGFNGHCYKDDSQITRLVVLRSDDDKNNPRVVVNVLPYRGGLCR